MKTNVIAFKDAPNNMFFLSIHVYLVALYGSDTWTLTNKLEKQLDGCYTRMLQTALNIN